MREVEYISDMLEKIKETSLEQEVLDRIGNAKLGAGPTLFWIAIASKCSKEFPEIWFRHDDLAEELQISRRSITKFLSLLIELEWIFDTKRLHRGRYRIYRINWYKNIRPAQILEIPPMIEESLFRLRPQQIILA